MAAVSTECLGYYTVEISLPEPEFIPKITDWVRGPHGGIVYPHSDGHDGELTIRAVIGRNVDPEALMQRVKTALNGLGLEST